MYLSWGQNHSFFTKNHYQKLVIYSLVKMKMLFIVADEIIGEVKCSVIF